MRKAMIVWGGWPGHDPDLCASMIRGWLKQEGFDVRIETTTAAFADPAIHDLSLLDLSVDPDTDAQAWSSTLRLAERFGLTTYDAAYLELAQRRALPLGSLDQPLCLAAGALGVAVIE